MAKVPPVAEILTDPEDDKNDSLSKKPVPVKDLGACLRYIKGDSVQVWRDTGGRRAPVPGPSEGGLWPVEMVRDGICDLPPVSIIKDPQTGMYFKVNLSVEAAVGQPINGYGQPTSQYDQGRVITDLAGMLMQRLDRADRRVEELENKLSASEKECSDLRLQLEQASAQPEGVLESLVNNMSKTETGQAAIAGTLSEVIERFSSKNKKR